MPAIKPPKRSSLRTNKPADSKPHRFESFSQRIARLKVQTIRSPYSSSLGDVNLSNGASFFKAAIDEWAELNLSESFTCFVRDVLPYCNSLPQVLHFQDKIFDLLICSIDQGNPLSLEPLLALLVQFARDLGPRFERHFHSALASVSSVAAHNPNIDAIEWSFTCLASLFKSLSRLLVPDLRPTYDLMAPLLGRELQKEYVQTFAAEAMSHLVRKAGLLYAKDPVPLKRLISHILADLHSAQDSSNFQSLQRGIISLLSGAIKGVQKSVHTCGIHILRCTLDYTLSEESKAFPTGKEVLNGAVMALLHNEKSDSIHLVFQLLEELLSASATNSNLQLKTTIAINLIVIVTGYQKGIYVSDWSPVIEALARLFSRFVSQDGYVQDEVAGQVLLGSALILHHAPMNVLTPRIQLIMDALSNERMHQIFLPFCYVFAELDEDRFRSIALPYLERFICSHWEQNEELLCILIPKLTQIWDTGKPGPFNSSLSCPQTWQRRIIHTLDNLATFISGPSSEEAESLIHLSKIQGYLRILPVLRMDVSARTALQHSLNNFIRAALQSDTKPSYYDNFAMGSAFASYVSSFGADEVIDISLWPLLCSFGARYVAIPGFLQGLLAYVDLAASRLNRDDAQLGPLLDALIRNLSGSIHNVRVLTLRILNKLYDVYHPIKSSLLSEALLIEDTPISLQTVRVLCMRIRNLAANYTSSTKDPWLKRIVPLFLCGLLNIGSSQIENDICAAIKAVAVYNEGEEEIATLALSFLEQLPECTTLHDRQSAAAVQKKVSTTSNYDDKHMSYVQSLAQAAIRSMSSPSEELQRAFIEAHKPATLQPLSPRLQSIQILQLIPESAERRSRILVPHFLEWASVNTIIEKEEPSPLGSTRSASPVTLSATRWTRRERKEMLDVIAKFKNPKALYRSGDVYSALLYLLANGGDEIRKPALEAILAWRNPGLKPYEDNLRNILDDTRFRDEVVTFVQGAHDDDRIPTEHRRDLVPVLLRLLFGKIVFHKGASSGKRTLEGKRKLVLKALANFPDQEVGEFIQIATATFTSHSSLTNRTDSKDSSLIDQAILRVQYGFLNLAGDMIKNLGPKLLPHVAQLLQSVLHCFRYAKRTVSTTNQAESSELYRGPSTSLLKSIRQSGCRCLSLLFTACPSFGWQPFMESVLCDVINPRLEKLPVETAQSPSGILQVFAAWARSRDTVLLFAEGDGTALAKMSDCLTVVSAKDEVRLCVLGIFRDIFDRYEDPNQINQCIKDRLLEKVIQPNINVFLTTLERLLRMPPSRDVLGAAVDTVTRIAKFVIETSEVRLLLDTFTFLLHQPLRKVNARVKVGLLQSLFQYLRLFPIHQDAVLQQKIFDTTSSLFSFFNDRTSRQNLSEILQMLVTGMPGLGTAAQLCQDLNSFSSDRIDEPDFDTRLRAFETISSSKLQACDAIYWQPIIHNLLYFIEDDREFALRANASSAIRRLLSNTQPATEEHAKLGDHVSNIILPAVKQGVKHCSELVRAEYVNVMAEMVRQFPEHLEVESNGMTLLLFGNDEEASFFSNILHIQQHRRMRALRRLADVAQKGRLSSRNISQFFLPLIENFVFQIKDDEAMHNLAAEAVNTIGALAEWMEWSQVKSLLKRIIVKFTENSDIEKVVIKVLNTLADSLARASQKQEIQISGKSCSTSSVSPDREDHPRKGAVEPAGTLSATITSPHKLAEELMAKDFVPALMVFLRNKEDSFVSLRVPVAVTVIKLLKLFPFEQLSIYLPPVLMAICQILRSRTPESRDMARKTLAEVVAVLGPDCFAFVVKELRGALNRGYQLHVLSFTTHSLLASGASKFRVGDLDYCLQQVIEIIMDDVFGTVGEEKDAENYISQMKEVKHNKSFDSMELIAKITSVSNLRVLIRPIQAVLRERLSLKQLQKIDELLRRLQVGISHNESCQDKSILVMCYELLQISSSDKAKSIGNAKEGGEEEQFKHQDFHGSTKKHTFDNSASKQSKLVRFSLEIARTALQKHDVLRTASNLTGLVPLVNDCLFATDEVRLSALRLLLILLRVPLPQLDRNLELYIREAVDYIKSSPGTNTELAQASIKLVTAVLRDRRDIDVNSSSINGQIAFVLRRLQQDLEEPDRQGATFNFLKAVLQRKILIPEVYEIMDVVASIMVTNQTRGARDLARGVYFQFLLHYPQGKERFSKQLKFLCTNLEYQYSEGRQSVLEVIHLLLSKTGVDIVQDILGVFMLPLVMVLMNDESPDCRAMARVLLREVFERADKVKTNTLLSLLGKWISQEESLALCQAALQCYALFFDVHETRAANEANLLQKRLQHLLDYCVTGDDSSLEVAHSTLQLLSTLTQKLPAIAFAPDWTSLWTNVVASLSSPSSSVQLEAAKLVGSYLADFSRASGMQNLDDLPLVGSKGLHLHATDITTLTLQSVALLESPKLKEELALQLTKNLVFLARCLAANQLKWDVINGSYQVAQPEMMDESEATDREGDSTKPDTDKHLALNWLFSRLSVILRRGVDTSRDESLTSKTAALKLIGTLCTELPADIIASCLPNILLPLQHHIDNAVTTPYSSNPDFNTSYKMLRSTSQEIIELLQETLGTAQLATAQLRISRSVTERREDRRRKRRIEVVTEPEKLMRSKRRKEERKKIRRKEKSAEYRGKRRGW